MSTLFGLRRAKPQGVRRDKAIESSPWPDGDGLP